MPTPVAPTPPDNPAIPYLYMWLYKNRKQRKRLSSHSRKVKNR